MVEGVNLLKGLAHKDRDPFGERTASCKKRLDLCIEKGAGEKMWGGDIERKEGQAELS